MIWIDKFICEQNMSGWGVGGWGGSLLRRQSAVLLVLETGGRVLQGECECPCQFHNLYGFAIAEIMKTEGEKMR